MKRRLLSVLLVLAMLLSLVPTAVFATEGDSGTEAANPYDTNGIEGVQYVALGDSMTNGYGLSGYYPKDKEGVVESAVILERGNRFGYMMNAETAWPSILAEAMDWDLKNLSISGMRPAELRFLLDETYIGDHYTWSQFIDHFNVNYQVEKFRVHRNATGTESEYAGKIYSQKQLELYKAISLGHLNAAKDYGNTGDWEEGWGTFWAANTRFAQAFYGKNNVTYTSEDERLAEVARIWNEHAGCDGSHDHEDGKTCWDVDYEKYFKDLAVQDWLGTDMGTELIRAEYLKYLAEADVITVHLGTNNFGTVVQDNLYKYIDGKEGYFVSLKTLLESDEEIEEYEKLREKLVKKVTAELATKNSEEDAAYYGGMVDRMVDVIAYSLVSFMRDYEISLNIIREMNSDAKIIYVGLVGAFEDVMLDLGTEVVNMDDLMGGMFDTANRWIADFVDESRGEVFVPVEDLHTLCDALCDGTIGDVYAAKALSDMMDWARDLPMPGKNQTLDEYWTSQGGGGHGSFANCLDNWMRKDEDGSGDYQYTTKRVGQDDVIEWVLGDTETRTKIERDIANGQSVMLSPTGGEVMPVFLKGVESFYQTISANKMDRTISGDALLLFFESGESGALDKMLADINSDNVSDITYDMMYLYARLKLAEGIGMHPSETGSIQIADAVKKALATNATGEEFIAAQTPVVLRKYYNILSSETLLNNDTLKVEMILKMYEVLNKRGDLKGYPEIDTVKKIYDYLDGKNYITDEQTMDIILSAYATMLNGMTERDIKDTALFIYNTLTGVKESKPVVAVASGSSSSGSMSAEKKLEVINDVYAILEGAYPTEIAQVSDIKAVFDKLEAADEEVALAVFETLFYGVLEPETAADIDVAGITKDVYTIVMNSDIDAAIKMEIIEDVADLLAESQLGVQTGLPTDKLVVIKKLREALKDYFTAEQLGVIIEDVSALIMDGTLTEAEKAALADKLHNELLGRDDLSAADKANIIAIVYGVLEEEGLVEYAIAGALAYAYLEAVNKGYIAGAIKGLQIAQDAIGTAKDYVNKKVPAEYAAIGELMIEELDNTAATLAELEALLKKDPATVTIADLMALENDLWDHLATLSKLGYAAGIEIDPQLKKINKAVVEFNAVVEGIIDEAYAIISTIESFPAAYAEWVESVGAKVDAFSPELGALVRKYLNDNAADAMAILAVYGDEAVAKLVAEAVAAHGELADVAMNLVYVLSVYGEDIYAAVENNAEVKALVEEIKAQLDKAEALVKAIEEAPFTSAYEAYVADKKAALDALHTEIAVLNSKLQKVVYSVIADVDPIAAEALADAIDALCEAMGIAYDAADGYMGWLADHAQAMVCEILCAVLDNTIEFIVAASPVFDQAAYDWLYNNPETVIAFFTENADEISALTEKYGAPVVAVIAYIGATYGPEVLDFIINNPCESLDLFMQWYNTYGYRIWPMIDVYLEALGVYDAIENQLSILDAHILAQIAALQAALKDAEENIKATVMAQIAALEETLKAYLKANISATYFVTSDSYYVALGDAGAYGIAADMLAAELGMTKQYANLTTVNATAADVMAALNAAEIAKADLITLGFSANAFTAAAAADLLAAIGFGDTVSEKDWNALVGEYGAEAVAAALAELNAYVTEQIGDADIAALLTMVVESYAYGYIAHLINYVTVSEAIHEINAEVLLVLVGMHNPMEGFAIDLNGETLDLGEYLDYLVTVTNVFSFAYALYANETIYVDAPDVEINYDGEVVDVMTFLNDLMNMAYGMDEKFVPTEAGYEYIQEQIYNALNPVFVDEDVECEHAFGGESTIVWTWFETNKGWDCSAYYRCAKCGEKFDLDCTVNAVVTKQPTVEEEGEAKYTASVEIEGQTYTNDKVVVLAKLPAGPDTGDTMMVGLYVTVMLVAAAGAIVVLKKRKHA